MARMEESFKAVKDASYRYSQPLDMELTQGEHEFTIDIAEGTFLLGNLYLEPVVEVPEYQASEKADGGKLITVSNGCE